MSKEDKEWTFLDDDGFLLMSNNSAHYSAKKANAQTNVNNVEYSEAVESSGSETEFEVIGKKQNSRDSDNEDLDIIRIKEDHFSSLQPPPIDIQDDGSDIEVIREMVTPPILVDCERTELLNSYQEGYENEFVSSENVSDISTFDAEEVLAGSLEEEKYITVKKYVDILDDTYKQDFELIPVAHTSDETFEDIINSEDSFGIARLFEEAVKGERQETLAATTKGQDSIQATHILPSKQNPHTVTLIFIVCASVTFGVIIGRGLTTHSTNLNHDAVIAKDEPRVIPEKEAPKAVVTHPTERKMPDSKQELYSATPIDTWRSEVQLLRYRNIKTAYDNLKIQAETLQLRYKALENEYRIFRLYTLLRKRKVKRSKRNIRKRGPVGAQVISPDPMSLPAMSQTAFEPCNVKRMYFNSTVALPMKEELLDLKRELWREKRKGEMWRQRYLNIKMESVSRCRFHFNENSRLVSFKHCLQRIGNFFNLTDIFHRSSKEDVKKNADDYLRKLRSKVSCGLKGVGKRFDRFWQTLKGKWCDMQGEEGNTKYQDTTKRQRGFSVPPVEVPKSNTVTPPTSKWARFRRMLHISNIVGSLRNAVSRRFKEKEVPRKNFKKDGTNDGSSVERGSCLKDRNMAECLQHFKKRWNFRERSPRPPVRQTDDHTNTDLMEETPQVHALSAIPDNFEISYPLPMYIEPQTVDSMTSDTKSDEASESSTPSEPVSVGDSDSGVERKAKIEPNTKIVTKSSKNLTEIKTLTKREMTDVAKKLVSEVEQELKERFKRFEKKILQHNLKLDARHKAKSSQLRKLEGDTILLFRFKLSHVESLFRRYSNRVRRERRKYQEEIKSLKSKNIREEAELRKNRVRFNSWIVLERMNIARELVQNARKFEKNIKSLEKWKTALRKRGKKRKQKIKAWLKERVKTLLNEVQEFKNRKERELNELDYGRRKEHLKKLKKTLRKEKKKMKNVYKYYKYSMEKAKKKLDDERKVYELAKAKAEELLITYESLLHKLRKEQSNGREDYIRAVDKRGQSDVSLVYPSVFCPDQKSCTSDEKSSSFSHVPVVYCPGKDSCVNEKGKDVREKGEQVDVSSEHIDFAKKEKVKVKRAKRSFRSKFRQRSYLPLSREALIKFNTDLHFKIAAAMRSKATHGTFQDKDLSKIMAKKEISDLSIFKSVHQALEKIRTASSLKYFNKAPVVKGKESQSSTGKKKSADWPDPLFYDRKTALSVSNERRVSVMWRGPLQYSPSTILAHDAQALHNYPPTTNLGNRNRDSSTSDREFTRNSYTTRQNIARATLPPLLYKNGLPRHPLPINSSVAGESSTLTQEAVVEEGEHKGDNDYNLPNYALPLSWYLHYAKGRAKLRSSSHEEDTNKIDWYLKMARGRKLARDVEDSASDWYLSEIKERSDQDEISSRKFKENWYLKMMEARNTARDQLDSGSDDWYLRMMHEREVERTEREYSMENWYLRQIKLKNEEREAPRYETEEGKRTQRLKKHDSCYLRPNERTKRGKGTCK